MSFSPRGTFMIHRKISWRCIFWGSAKYMAYSGAHNIFYQLTWRQLQSWTYSPLYMSTISHQFREDTRANKPPALITLMSKRHGGSLMSHLNFSVIGLIGWPGFFDHSRNCWKVLSLRPVEGYQAVEVPLALAHLSRLHHPQKSRIPCHNIHLIRCSLISLLAWKGVLGDMLAAMDEYIEHIRTTYLATFFVGSENSI